MNSLPEPTHMAADNEAYWDTVRAQYAVSPDFINLENGYFGVQATPVFDAFMRYLAQVNAQTSYFLRERFAPEQHRVMQALAVLCGVGMDEIILTRNLVEGMNILLQGYPFQAGDEVLCATHDYDSVVETLEMVRQRKGLGVVRVTVPLDPHSDEQLVQLYAQAITPRTRVLLVTHMVHRTGQIMPVAKIAAMAKSRGIDVMVDAAHSFAQLQYQLPDLGAEFVAVNLHKWLGAPLGLALVYIRKTRVAEMSPLFGDTQAPHDSIAKLAHLGTVPPAPILTIGDALDFHYRIGAANKEARLRYLSRYWMEQVRGLPGITLLSPSDPARYCAIGAFQLAGVPAKKVVQRLMDEHRIFTVVREVDGQQCVRITPHVYTRLSDLDLLVSALGAMAPRA
jgi:selenocysteine lyase/cysteine desulfurase